MRPIEDYEHKIDRLSEECPVKATLDVIRGRWKASILFHLLNERKRFSELQEALPGVTAQVLSLQLRQLEADGILTRTVYAEVPARVEYGLSEYGRTLSAVFEEMEAWGKTYQSRLKARSGRAAAP